MYHIAKVSIQSIYQDTIQRPKYGYEGIFLFCGMDDFVLQSEYILPLLHINATVHTNMHRFRPQTAALLV